jgi:glucokinase
MSDPAHPSYIAAIDIGGTNTKIALVSRHGPHLETLRKLPTPVRGDPESFLMTLVEQVQGLRARPEPVSGVGIAMPGFLSEDSEMIEYIPNAPALLGFPWRKRMERALGIPVTLEIDCNAAALGEYRFGAGRSVRRLLVLSLGTGVGGGMLVDGKPLRFTAGCCGDVGHVYVGGEERCSAGCTGCLEAMVSVEALSSAAARAWGDPRNGAVIAVRTLIEAAIAGEEKSAGILRQAGRYVGIGVASLCSFLRPDLVLLAGGISEAGDLLTVPANEAFRQHTASYFHVPINKACLGASAGLAGAAAALLTRFEADS